MATVCGTGFSLTTILKRQNFPALSGKRASNFYIQIRSSNIIHTFYFACVNLLKDFWEEKEIKEDFRVSVRMR
jgi:hypothetical protein